MWRLILKNQELATTSLGGTLDWENEAIPDERDDDCKKWLKGLYDLINKYADVGSWGVKSSVYGPNIFDSDRISENLACAIKDYYTEASDINTRHMASITPTLEPFLDRHGVNKDGYSMVIGNDVTSFEVIMAIEDNQNRMILLADVSFYPTEGPFKKAFELIKRDKGKVKLTQTPISKDAALLIGEVLGGLDKETKRLCSFIKEYSEYINRPEVIEEFVDFYADRWRYIMAKNYRHKDTYSEEQFKNLIRNYFK